MVEAKRTGKKHPSTYGLPAFAEVPRVKVALQNKPLDFYGFERWVLSSRAKALLEGCDADAFDFVECETTAPPAPFDRELLARQSTARRHRF